MRLLFVLVLIMLLLSLWRLVRVLTMREREDKKPSHASPSNGAFERIEDAHFEDITDKPSGTSRDS